MVRTVYLEQSSHAGDFVLPVTMAPLPVTVYLVVPVPTGAPAVAVAALQAPGQATAGQAADMVAMVFIMIFPEACCLIPAVVAEEHINQIVASEIMVVAVAELQGILVRQQQEPELLDKAIIEVQA